jgi:hypothetical protein
MSPVTMNSAGLRTAVEVDLKGEGKILRMMNAQANADRRQGNVTRLSAAPRVLRRSVNATHSHT